jgi:hypothetical protein
VLQATAVTDLVGGQLADRQAGTGPAWLWYGLAGLLGLAVATSIEAAAGYLMWLYDQHLRARDSVWQLRVGMLVYVGISAIAIHWWLGYRGLPELVAWVLAGMSASSLWLWSRGSRWAQRREMIAAGQIDPALPRLPTSAKLLHPIRSLITVYLISWEPVATVDEARARYAQWRTARRTPPAARRPDRPARRTATPAAGKPDTRSGQEPASPLASVRSITGRTADRPRRSRAGEVSVDQLARTLDREFSDRVPGSPTALSALRRVHGSCSRARAIAAVKRLSGWRNGEADRGDDDGEREAA